jgi:hypothetical protein
MEVGAGAALKCEMVGKACTTRKEPILESYSVEPILLNRSRISFIISLCQRIYIGDCRIRRRRKFKLVFFLDTSFKSVFWLDTTLKLVNS